MKNSPKKNLSKVSVSERALLARLNRALMKEGKKLRKCRPDMRGYGELGDYYCVNTETGFIDAQNVDLEVWAREQGLLKSYEVLEQGAPASD